MNISSKGNVHKSSFGLCSRAPGPIKGSGAQKQRPQECLATLWFEKRVNLCSNPRFLKKKLKFQLTYGSSNWLSLIAIDFTQSTWFTTSKVNCKNISEFLSKNFPIDFQSPIDFSQLHMIRPLVFINVIFLNWKILIGIKTNAIFLAFPENFQKCHFWTFSSQQNMTANTTLRNIIFNY